MQENIFLWFGLPVRKTLAKLLQASVPCSQFFSSTCKRLFKQVTESKMTVSS